MDPHLDSAERQTLITIEEDLKMRRGQIVYSALMFICVLASCAPCSGSSDVEPLTDAKPLAVLNSTDEDGKKEGSITFLDPESYRVLNSIEVGRLPSSAFFGPGENFIYVLSAGGGNRPGSISVIDVNKRKMTTEIDVGPTKGINPYEHLNPLYGKWIKISEDGLKIFLLSSSGDRRDPSRLLVVDRNTNRKTGSLDTAPLAISYEQSPDGRLIYVLHGAYYKKLPARLTVVDVYNMKIASEKDLSFGISYMALSSDKNKLVVISSGLLTSKSKESGMGHLWILDSRSGQEIQSIDLGHKPSWSVDRLTGDLWTHSTSSQEKSVVRVIRNGSISRQFEVGGGVTKVFPGPAGEKVFVIYEKGDVSLKDLSGVAKDQQFSLSFKPGYLLVSDDGRRAFLKEALGAKVAVLDLESGRVLAIEKTGRAGQRVGEALGEALSGVVFGVWILPDVAQTGMVLGPSDRFLYVLNTQTTDVTIIDTATAEVIDKIGIGPGVVQQIMPSPNGQFLITESSQKVQWIDMETNLVVSEYDLRLETKDIPGEISFREDRGEALIPTATGMEIVDLNTGRKIKAIGKLHHPRSILVPSLPNR